MDYLKILFIRYVITLQYYDTTSVSRIFSKLLEIMVRLSVVRYHAGTSTTLQEMGLMLLELIDCFLFSSSDLVRILLPFYKDYIFFQNIRLVNIPSLTNQCIEPSSTFLAS